VGEAALSGEEKQGILMFVRRYPLLGKARADEIAAPYVRALRASTAWDSGDHDPGVEDSLPFPAAEYLAALGRKMGGNP
jgi:hypothetical protein